LAFLHAIYYSAQKATAGEIYRFGNTVDTFLKIAAEVAGRSDNEHLPELSNSLWAIVRDRQSPEQSATL
jgi:hypothetical protein